jgi:hypothetical protein
VILIFSFIKWSLIKYVPGSVVDPHNVDVNPDADPDSTYQPDADPDSDFFSMGIRMRTWI